MKILKIFLVLGICRFALASPPQTEPICPLLFMRSHPLPLPIVLQHLKLSPARLALLEEPILVIGSGLKFLFSELKRLRKDVYLLENCKSLDATSLREGSVGTYIGHVVCTSAAEDPGALQVLERQAAGLIGRGRDAFIARVLCGPGKQGHTGCPSETLRSADWGDINLEFALEDYDLHLARYRPEMPHLKQYPTLPIEIVYLHIQKL